MTTDSREGATAGIARRMTECAAAFLDGLSPDLRSVATFDFTETGERTNWAYFPREIVGDKTGHRGLALGLMDRRQAKLAHALIGASLSLHAYAKATAIMALESVLNLLEERRLDAVRDPGRYFVSIFGEPGPGVWGWRLEGHHICLNFTLAGEIIGSTPLFLGANPAEVRHGDVPIIRPCAEEEDAARELLGSLDSEQRRLAVICEVAPPDFVLTNSPYIPETSLPGEVGAVPVIQAQFNKLTPHERQALRFDRAAPIGLSANHMSNQQRRGLLDLINVYVERLPPTLAGLERARMEADGLGHVTFAWAGEERPRRPHYYRIQGRSFLAEYDNTQDDSNHVHAVWRDTERDFGADLLREHRRLGH